MSCQKLQTLVTSEQHQLRYFGLGDMKGDIGMSSKDPHWKRMCNKETESDVWNSESCRITNWIFFYLPYFYDNNDGGYNWNASLGIKVMILIFQSTL